MSFINLDENYFEHVKVKRLIGKLGAGAELIPLMLWCHAAKYAPIDGVLKGYSNKEIAQICQWQGDTKDATSMLQALLDLNFVLLTKNGDYKIWEWELHQGHIVTFADRAKYAANKRWEKHRIKRKDATSIANTEISITTSNAPNLTKPNLTKRNNSVFLPPTMEQINDYAKEQKLEGFNAAAYFDYNERAGWVLANGKKMKDWKADMRYVYRFKSNGYKSPQKTLDLR